MKPEEKAEKLQQRQTLGLSDDEVIKLCFDVIAEHPSEIEKCRAAVVLSGIIQKGLGKRTREFLDNHPYLPPRVHEVLRSAIMRMECF